MENDKILSEQSGPLGGKKTRARRKFPCNQKNVNHRWGFGYHQVNDKIERVSDYTSCLRCGLDKRAYRRQIRETFLLLEPPGEIKP